MTDMTEQIEKDRALIDDIDELITALIARRYDVADGIGLMKEIQGEKIRDLDREGEVLDHVASVAEENGMDPEAARRIYRQIVMSCASRQQDQHPKL